MYTYVNLCSCTVTLLTDLSSTNRSRTLSSKKRQVGWWGISTKSYSWTVCLGEWWPCCRYFCGWIYHLLLQTCLAWIKVTMWPGDLVLHVHGCVQIYYIVITHCIHWCDSILPLSTSLPLLGLQPTPSPSPYPPPTSSFLALSLGVSYILICRIVIQGWHPSSGA